MKESRERHSERTIQDVKDDYEVFAKRYSLPDFDELNKDFYVERAADIETEFLLREIRRFIADRYSNYMRFVETILNPANAPIFIFSVIKLLGKEDKKRLEEIYSKFMKIEIELVELDISYDEKKEAEFIKSSYEIWQEIKKSLLEVVETIKKNKDNKSEKNNGGYFG